MSVLYLSYDGLMEQLGQSQVLPYLCRLARGRPVTLVSYEKGRDLDDAARKARFADMAEKAGIRWIPLRYHKTPSTLATAYDLAVGLAVCAFHCAAGRVRIVHARGYVTSVLALILKRLFGVRFIFDMRGFWVTQRVELGIWRENSSIFRIARWFEARFLQEADFVFALSPAAVTAMKGWPAVIGRPIRFAVVTVCTDLERFMPPPDCARRRHETPFTLGYVGNAGAGYIFEPVLDLYLAICKLRPDARLKIVNRNDHALILDHMRERGIACETVDLSACDYTEVPQHIWTMDAGVFFVRPDPSRISSVPTRMGEFLACGVPCVGNAGVAWVQEVLEGDGVGVVLRDFEPNSVAGAAHAILELASSDVIRRRCVEAARRHFSLKTGVATYEKVYQELERDVS